MQTFFALTGFALFISGVTWLVVKGRQLNRQRDFERRVHARKLGWTYFGTGEGRVDYRFSGSASDIEWAMWYDSDRGDRSPTPKAHWQSANVRTPQLSLVIIGRKRYQMESGIVGRLLIDVVTGVAQAVGGGQVRADKTEFYESALTLDEGRAGFRERYAIAVSPEMPGGWLDDELQAALLDWPKPKRGALYRGDEKIEVTLGPDGLQIVAQQMPEDFAFWNHLARLGEALAQ
nr:hypothetical protein [Burkholderiaceae bacterium]